MVAAVIACLIVVARTEYKPRAFDPMPESPGIACLAEHIRTTLGLPVASTQAHTPFPQSFVTAHQRIQIPGRRLFPDSGASTRERGKGKPSVVLMCSAKQAIPGD